jgi:hypothetical protein
MRFNSLAHGFYQDIDEESGVDRLEVYTQFDRKCIVDHVIPARQDIVSKGDKEPPAVRITENDTFLIDRLADTISSRRRALRYW